MGKKHTFQVFYGLNPWKSLYGDDKKFVNTKATAKDNQVVIESPIEHPAMVRYAWKDNPVNARLYSKKDLPASPFEINITQ